MTSSPPSGTGLTDHIIVLDKNGNELWRQSILGGEMGWALHPEGVVFILQADYDHNPQFTLWGRDAETGQNRFAPDLLL